MFTASDILLKAASRIEEEGMWCQGRYFAVRGGGAAYDTARDLQRRGMRVPECALGAMASATIELGATFVDWSLATVEFERYLNETPSQFNDAPGQTAFEVAAAMRQAAL